jgi:hypothetical protein
MRRNNPQSELRRVEVQLYLGIRRILRPRLNCYCCRCDLTCEFVSMKLFVEIKKSLYDGGKERG